MYMRYIAEPSGDEIFSTRKFKTRIIFERMFYYFFSRVIFITKIFRSAVFDRVVNVDVRKAWAWSMHQRSACTSWQSWTSVLHSSKYSRRHFIYQTFAAFEAPHRWKSVKGGAPTRFKARNGSSAIWRFKHSNAIEIRDGRTFDFYTGLPHISLFVKY